MVDNKIYQHNADGFLLIRGGDTLLYNIKGELLHYKFKSSKDKYVDYRYDGLHRLIERKYKQDKTLYFYGDSEHPIRLTHFIHNGKSYALHYDHRGFLISLEASDHKVLYVMTDHIGTPVAVFDDRGTLIKQIIYNSFGNKLEDSDPSLYIPLGFAAGISDPATNLIRFHFRDYDPILGQWTARDPSLFSSHQPNLYQYVFNDPVNFRDPVGLFCIGAEVYAAAGVGGGGGTICIDRHGIKVCIEGGAKRSLSGGGAGYSFDPFGSSGADDDKNLGWSLTGKAEGSISAGGHEAFVSGEVDLIKVWNHFKRTGKLDPCAFTGKVGLKQTLPTGEQLTTELGYNQGTGYKPNQNLQYTKPPGLEQKFDAQIKATITGCYTKRW